MHQDKGAEMTVAELIEELRKCDPSAEIGITDYLTDWDIEVICCNPHIHERCLGEVYIVLGDER
jgi:hypothetical protein